MSKARTLKSLNTLLEIDISVNGIDAKLFREDINVDKWKAKISGGFYNWFIPLDEALDRAHHNLNRISLMRVENRIKYAKHQSKLK